MTATETKQPRKVYRFTQTFQCINNPKAVDLLLPSERGRFSVSRSLFELAMYDNDALEVDA